MGGRAETSRRPERRATCESSVTSFAPAAPRCNDGPVGPELGTLIEAAVNGDNRAVGELVRLTQARVTVVCRALGSGDDVDDLVQDTYLRAFRSLPTFHGPPSSFVPWLLAIARNACVTEVQRRIRRRDAVERLRATRQETTTPASASRSELEQLLDELRPDLREAFVLTQLVGLSYDEAAETCDCPVGTIRSRVSRARAQLAARVRDIDRTA